MATEKRLIDANALIEHLTRCKVEAKGLFGSVCMAIKCFVEQMPTVDAVEVKHGRWIVDESGVIICSECGAEHEWQDYRASFCEDCGAKMDGDGNG